jgi:lipoprotein signal peptidase
VPISSLFDALALRVAAVVFLCAFAVDLVSKEWAVAHQDRVIVFNHSPTELPFRVLMSLVTVAIGLLIARLATQRGLGRQWGVWIGCSLLVAGILANGVSPLLWARGVPDFIDVRDGWFWNVADFEIAIGLTGGLLSVAFSAVVVYTRERVVRRRS